MIKPVLEARSNKLPLIPEELTPIFREDPYLALRLGGLLDHARRTDKWKQTLYAQFPFIPDFEGKYEAEFNSASYSDMEYTDLDGLDMRITTSEKVGQIDAGQLFWFKYSSQNYPSLGVTKGIVIQQHKDPEHANFLDYVLPEKWEKPFDAHDPEFEQIAAMGLNKTLGRLTHYRESHVKALLQSYADQVGLYY